MPRGYTATDDEKQAFLDELARTGVVADAMRHVHITSYSTIHNWKKDPEFAVAFENAEQIAADALESEARRRAVEGVKREKVIGSGENARFIEEHQYSDTLLMFLLKGSRPDKFADRTKSELSGPEGKPLGEGSDMQAAARLAAIFEEARRRRDEEGEIDDPLLG